MIIQNKYCHEQISGKTRNYEPFCSYWGGEIHSSTENSLNHLNIFNDPFSLHLQTSSPMRSGKLPISFLLAFIQHPDSNPEKQYGSKCTHEHCFLLYQVIHLHRMVYIFGTNNTRCNIESKNRTIEIILHKYDVDLLRVIKMHEIEQRQCHSRWCLP